MPKSRRDDGYRSDKVTRIQHLASLSAIVGRLCSPGLEVIACIGGRGFKQRREDIKKNASRYSGKGLPPSKTLTRPNRLAPGSRIPVEIFRSIAGVFGRFNPAPEADVRRVSCRACGNFLTLYLPLADEALLFQADSEPAAARGPLGWEGRGGF